MAHRMVSQKNSSISLSVIMIDFYSCFSGDINSLVLSRLLFCVGQIAFLQMVHCEVVVAMELKEKRASDDAKNMSGKTPTSSRKVSYQCW